MTEKNAAAPADAEYLIRKGGYYYRPNAQGYTPSIEQAGRFTLEQAISYSHPNGPDGPRDGIAYELAPAKTADLLQHPDLAGHIADTLRDICAPILGRIITFYQSKAIADAVLKAARQHNAAYAAVIGNLQKAQIAQPDTCETAQINCERCQGNGEIVTDWDRYMHARDGDKGDEAVAECPDCDGTGKVDEPEPRDEEIERLREDAEKWRGLMACQRIRCMGGSLDGNHIGIEFWINHPAAHPSKEYPQEADREGFDAFARAALAKSEGRA